MSNKPYGGIVLTIREAERAETIKDRIHRDGRFTAAVSSRDHHPKELDTYVISLSGSELEFVCLGRGGSGVVTGSRRVTFRSFIGLNELLLEELELSENAKEKIAEALRHEARRLPAEIWPALLLAIKKARPQIAAGLDEIENIRNAPRITPTDNARLIIAEERDIAGLAAKIFGLKQEDVFDQVRPTTTAIPFLNQVRHHVLYEDAILMNDWLALPDWQFLGQTKFAAAQFIKSGEVLSIFNVNKMPLEHCLGADLVYYHHLFHAFVMVQYKRLERSNGDWQFDLNNKQFQKQLSQMDTLHATLPASAPAIHWSNYRLGEECCFFKFCKPHAEIATHSTDLIDGMYVPANYLALLKVTPETAGKFDGRILNYKNVGRHINNTGFVSMVSHGWIGSRNLASDFLAKVVRECVEEGRSVTFARSRKMTEAEELTTEQDQAVEN
jgi:hypothetical protein